MSFRRRPSLWFAVAAVLGALAWFGTLRAAANGDTIAVLVADHDLSVGSDPGAAGNSRWEAVPAAAVLRGMLTDADAVAQRRLAVPVGADEPITDGVLGGATSHAPRPLAPGERAMSVPAVAAGAALPVLVPGARVDVVASIGDHAAARPVVLAAEVISVQAGDEQAPNEGGAILLRVSVADALRLSGAIDHAAGLRLLPRPFAEGDRP